MNSITCQQLQLQTYTAGCVIPFKCKLVFYIFLEQNLFKQNYYKNGLGDKVKNPQKEEKKISEYL